MTSKNNLRDKYKALRSSLTPSLIETQSLDIANNALQLPIWDKTYYHIFLPITTKNEVNTEYILHILNGKDKSILVPKSDFKTNTLSHILLQENTKIQRTQFNIPEPVSGIEVLASQIDVVFVPLLAYDKQGNRLGYGKGFYDRFLASCKPSTLFVGLSFFEPEEVIPFEESDIPLHYCISPNSTYSFI